MGLYLSIRRNFQLRKSMVVVLFLGLPFFLPIHAFAQKTLSLESFAGAGVTADECKYEPIQAYVKGIPCRDGNNQLLPSPINAKTANATLPYTRGGCVLQAAIIEERLQLFKEVLAKGGEPKKCPGYPSDLYRSITGLCRSKPDMAHEFFSLLRDKKTLPDLPQVLMWHSTVDKCVEGVQLALQNGAVPNQPEEKNWDKGLLSPMALRTPLEATIGKGIRKGRESQTLEILKLLMDAGADPMAVDSKGRTLLSRAQEAGSRSTYWPEIKKLLCRNSTC